MTITSCMINLYITNTGNFAPTQDGDDASPVLTSCDIVKVPDPQMGMVRDRAPTLTQLHRRKKKFSSMFSPTYGLPAGEPGGEQASQTGS